MVAGSGSSGSATSTFGTRPERLRRRPGERLGCRSRNHEGVLSTWIDDDAGTIRSWRTARTLCPMNGTDEAPSAAPRRSDSSVVKATRKTLPSSSCHVSNAPSVSSARTRNSASGSNSFRPRRRSHGMAESVRPSREREHQAPGDRDFFRLRARLPRTVARGVQRASRSRGDDRQRRRAKNGSGGESRRRSLAAPLV